MRRRWFGTIVALTLGLAFASAVPAGCAKNAATGRWQIQLLSREQAIQTGTDLAPQLTAEYGGASADTVASEYVREIGEKLAATTEADYPDLPWEFTLLDSDVINAFALPGGKVFISRGLASRMRNEAQLAAVLGHEIGHVTARHVNDRMVQATVANGGQALLDALLNGQNEALQQVGQTLYGFGGQSTILAYGRSQEIESDALGMRYMNNVGYNPRGQRQVMEILAKASGDNREWEFLSTHPYPETRIRRIDESLKADYSDVASTANGFFAARFQERMLDRIGWIQVSVDDAPHWCGVCQARAIASAD
ncbi:MAG: M48 family metallopeptidase [Planctomycetota bacterium]